MTENNSAPFQTGQAIVDAYRHLFSGLGDFFRLSFPLIILAIIVYVANAILINEVPNAADGTRFLSFSAFDVPVLIVLLFIKGLFLRAWLRRRLDPSWHPSVLQAIMPDRTFWKFYGCYLLLSVLSLSFAITTSLLFYVPIGVAIGKAGLSQGFFFASFLAITAIMVFIIAYCSVRVGLIFPALAMGETGSILVRSLRLTQSMGGRMALALIGGILPLFLLNGIFTFLFHFLLALGWGHAGLSEGWVFITILLLGTVFLLQTLEFAYGAIAMAVLSRAFLLSGWQGK